MSACISREGEYSDHVPDKDFCCTRCFALDEAGLLDRVRELEAEKARIAPLFENLSREYPVECNKRVKAEAERDAALSTIAKVREAVSGHPECDQYEDSDAITCGWKNAYASVVRALGSVPSTGEGNDG